MGLWTKQQLREFIKENKLVSAQDAQNALKELFAETLQEMLEAEMDAHLGCQKHDMQNKQTTNSRNGKSKKSSISEYGEQEIVIPRDHEGEFEPLVVKKHQTNVTGIEDQIVALYAKGISTREIQDHLNNLYGIKVSPTFISNVTIKIVPLIKEWQNRPLQAVYAVVFLDAIHFKVKHEGSIVNKAAYMVIGIDLDGCKVVLGMWIGENESSKFWLSVLNDLKNRGVQDILISGQLNRLHSSDYSLLSAYGNTKVHHSSDSQLYSICLLQRLEESNR